MTTESPSRLKERELQVLWVSGYGGDVGRKPGSFYQTLIQAFFQADRENRLRLKIAFPITGEAFDNYMSGELSRRYGLDEKEK